MTDRVRPAVLRVDLCSQTLRLASLVPAMALASLLLVGCGTNGSREPAATGTVDNDAAADVDVDRPETRATANPTSPAAAAAAATSVPSPPPDPTPNQMPEIDFPETIDEFAQRWAVALERGFEGVDTIPEVRALVTLPDSTVSRSYEDGTPYEAFDLVEDALSLQFVIDGGVITDARLFTVQGIGAEPTQLTIQIARTLWLSTIVGGSESEVQGVGRTIADAQQSQALPAILRGVEWNARGGLLLAASPKPGQPDTIAAPGPETDDGTPTSAAIPASEESTEDEHYWQTCGIEIEEVTGESDEYKDAFCALSQSFPPEALSDRTVQAFIRQASEGYRDGLLNRAILEEMVLAVPGNEPGVIEQISFFAEG
jgi:hypothetical protein